MKALLALEDGLVLGGRSFTGPGESAGEVVFNTAMTGYQEILTDPSYKGQIVTMTYPLMGNYGVNPEDLESRGTAARAARAPQPPAGVDSEAGSTALSAAGIGTVGAVRFMVDEPAQAPAAIFRLSPCFQAMTFFRLSSSENCGRRPVRRMSLLMSGTRRCMSSKPCS